MDRSHHCPCQVIQVLTTLVSRLGDTECTSMDRRNCHASHLCGRRTEITDASTWAWISSCSVLKFWTTKYATINFIHIRHLDQTSMDNRKWRCSQWGHSLDTEHGWLRTGAGSWSWCTRFKTCERYIQWPMAFLAGLRRHLQHHHQWWKRCWKGRVLRQFRNIGKGRW